MPKLHQQKTKGKHTQRSKRKIVFIA